MPSPIAHLHTLLNASTNPLRSIDRLLELLDGINPKLPMAPGFAAEFSDRYRHAYLEAEAVQTTLASQERRLALLTAAAGRVVQELLLRDTDTDRQLAHELIRSGIANPFPAEDDRADHLHEQRRAA